MSVYEDIHIRYSGPNPHRIMTIAHNFMTIRGLCEIEYAGPECVDFTLWHFNEDYTTQMKSVLDDVVTELKGRIEYLKPTHGLYFERQWEEEE